MTETIYAQLAADFEGPIELDVYVWELQHTVTDSVQYVFTNKNAIVDYNQAVSELAELGQKPAIVLDVPSTGLELPRAADLLSDDQDDQDVTEADDDQDGENDAEQPVEQPVETAELSFAERMAAARAAKKAAAAQ